MVYVSAMRTRLTDLPNFDIDRFFDLMADRYIDLRTHAYDQRFVLANYSPSTMYEQKWTPETLVSRGIIFNYETYEILARPFDKFFNWDDSTQPYPPHGAAVRSEKVDGSLGTLYAGPAGLAVASRGSFHSDQAKHATRRLNDYLDVDSTLASSLMSLLQNEKTPVFEIVYPENRIVVDYGEMDELILLDVIDNATGKSDLTTFDELTFPWKATKTLLPQGFYDTIASDIPEGEEGFVLYWPHSGFRCKVKSADYIALHRILTNTSAREIWRYLTVNANRTRIAADKPQLWGSRLGIDPKRAQQILSVGDNWFEQMIEGVPDEFYQWVQDTISSIEKNVEAYVMKVVEGGNQVRYSAHGDARKMYDLSQHFEHKYSGAVLRYAQSSDINSVVLNAWKNAFPADDKPFANNEGE